MHVAVRSWHNAKGQNQQRCLGYEHEGAHHDTKGMLRKNCGRFHQLRVLVAATTAMLPETLVSSIQTGIIKAVATGNANQ